MLCNFYHQPLKRRNYIFIPCTPCLHYFLDFTSMYSFPKRISCVFWSQWTPNSLQLLVFPQEKYNLYWYFISLFLVWKRSILESRTSVHNILLDINMFIPKEHFFKIKYYLSHYLFKEFYRNIFIITPGDI